MKVLISKQAQENLTRLSPQDRKMVAVLFEIMEAEHFPRIGALLRSDYATEDGMLVRVHKGLRIVYRFLEDRTEQTALIVSVHRKNNDRE